jgi:hypothetical protein
VAPSSSCRRSPDPNFRGSSSRSRSRQRPPDPRLVVGLVGSTISRAHALMASRCRGAAARCGVGVGWRVSRCHVRWLGLMAFRRVLGR